MESHYFCLTYIGGEIVPKISLTDLVDIVSVSGTSKAKKVAAIKNRPGYDPKFDFYKPFREHLVNVHSSDGSRDQVQDILSQLSDPKKLSSYRSVVQGYQSWWGRKQLKWFDPPTTSYVASGIEVRVNPELGLAMNGLPHVIKLYLKSGKLTRTHTDIVLHLMEKSLRAACSDDTVFCVLDVRNSKLAQLSAVDPTVLAVVKAELAYVSSIWAEL